jgi:two-component system chemotaxis response regulator CheB
MFITIMGRFVVIAASMGGVDALRLLVTALPVRCTASIFVVLHIGSYKSVLAQVLSPLTSLVVAQPMDGASIEPGHIYLAPPDQHMVIEPGRIRLSRGPKVHHTRPAADPLFMSAAEVYREQVIGIVLTGGDGDGAAGLRQIKAHGGLAIVQDPDEAQAPGMPLAALAADHPDLCLSLPGITAKLRTLCVEPGS